MKVVVLERRNNTNTCCAPDTADRMRREERGLANSSLFLGVIGVRLGNRSGRSGRFRAAILRGRVGARHSRFRPGDRRPGLGYLSVFRLMFSSESRLSRTMDLSVFHRDTPNPRNENGRRTATVGSRGRARIPRGTRKLARRQKRELSRPGL